MASLYARLYTYRERRDRRPLEDFLTEALCDILNRLPRAEMSGFAAELFLPREALEAWDLQFDRTVEYHWTTREPTDDGRIPDLVLYRGDQPMIVVENKVGAGLALHQLEDYGRWLKDYCAGRDWPGVIVFLTHYTPPPEDFGASAEGIYGVRWQRVCRWPAVWKWLDAKGSLRTTEQFRNAWQVLAKELAEFLREKEVISDTMTQLDFAAAKMYIASASRTRRLFERLWNEAIAPNWKDVGFKHDPSQVMRGPLEYDSERGVIWDWINLSAPYAAAPQASYLDGASRSPKSVPGAKTCSPPAHRGPMPSSASPPMTLEADCRTRSSLNQPRDGVRAIRAVEY
jgi:PD-(D/E)XK nuclease superfamily